MVTLDELEAYSDAGGTYVLSKSEERVAHFDTNRENIKYVRC